MDTLDKRELEQLKYIQQMDMITDMAQKDSDNMTWKVKSITSHHVRKREGKRQILI